MVTQSPLDEAGHRSLGSPLAPAGPALPCRGRFRGTSAGCLRGSTPPRSRTEKIQQFRSGICLAARIGLGLDLCNDGGQFICGARWRSRHDLDLHALRQNVRAWQCGTSYYIPGRLGRKFAGNADWGTWIQRQQLAAYLLCFLYRAPIHRCDRYDMQMVSSPSIFIYECLPRDQDLEWHNVLNIIIFDRNTPAVDGKLVSSCCIQEFAQPLGFIV